MSKVAENQCAGCANHSPLGWFEATFLQADHNGKAVSAWFYGTCCQGCHLSAVWPQTREEQFSGSVMQEELAQHCGWTRKKQGQDCSGLALSVPSNGEGIERCCESVRPVWQHSFALCGNELFTYSSLGCSSPCVATSCGLLWPLGSLASFGIETSINDA